MALLYASSICPIVALLSPRAESFNLDMLVSYFPEPVCFSNASIFNSSFAIFLSISPFPFCFNASMLLFFISIAYCCIFCAILSTTFLSLFKPCSSALLPYDFLLYLHRTAFASKVFATYSVLSLFRCTVLSKSLTNFSIFCSSICKCSGRFSCNCCNA